MEKKPFKVWSANRRVRKSIVASTLQELHQKGAVRLGIPQESVRTIVLEEDGTEVDDEEYFQFLEHNTVFMFLEEGEEWQDGVGNDSVDYRDIVDAAGVGGDSDSDVADSPQEERDSQPQWRQIAKLLRGDISRIVTFDSHQLELLTTVGDSQLAQVIRCSPGDARSIQMTCQRYLDERADSEEARALLQMLASKSIAQPGPSPETSTKRPRVE